MVRAATGLKDLRAWFAMAPSRSWHDRGATAVEYSLIVAFIAAVVVVVVTVLGTHVSADFSSAIGF